MSESDESQKRPGASASGSAGSADTIVDDDPPPPAKVGASLLRGDPIGRFVVLECIGEGGMGVVYAAYDPELDRKLAVKLIRPHRESEEARARLSREAQAMARLSHPNVCVVHDVGTHDGHVYIAMEFVEGRTLGRWLAEMSPDRDEIVARFVEAGQGLVAAHQAGLVHRDFKPDNVLLGDDGRVRVMDFGLARQAATDSTEPPSPAVDPKPNAVVEPNAFELPSGSLSGEDRLSRPLTRAGSIAGTPAYMAPEQHLGLAVEAAADQFSFCVALYEALHGERPFAGRGMRSLMTAILRGEVRKPPAGSTVPAALRTALLRGLRADPSERWPSMDELLTALEYDPRTRRRRITMTGFAVVALGGTVFGGYAVGSRDPCGDVSARSAAVWGVSRRVAARQAFAATGLPYATDTWARVEHRIDAHVEGWRSMRTEACQATHVRHEQSGALLDLRMTCLDRRLAEIDALLDVFVVADARVAENASSAVEHLRPLERCADAEALRARVPPPADAATREAVGSIRTAIDRGEALEFAGREDEALALVTEAVQTASSAGYAPVEAEARLALGSILDSGGDHDGAVRELETSLLTALGSGHDAIAVEAATQLVHVLGVGLSRHDDAERWGRQAAALIERTGRPWDREVELATVLGSVYEDAARLDEARRNHERALAIREAKLGPESLDVARTLNNLGSVLESQGAFDEAHDYARRSVAMAEAVLGPNHPQLRPFLNNLGVVLDDLGDYEGALEAYDRALAVSTASLGPHHPGIASLLSNAGVSLLKLRRYDASLDYSRRALAAWEASVGSEHAHVASALNNIATAQIQLELRDEALQTLERAIAVWTNVYGPEHPSVAGGLVNQGAVLYAQDDLGGSRRLFERAVAIYEAALGPTHPALAPALLHLSNVVSDAEAVALLERAVAVAARADPETEASVRFALAQALVDAGRDLQTARAHAEHARHAWAGAGDAAHHRVLAVDAWLAEQ